MIYGYFLIEILGKGIIQTLSRQMGVVTTPVFSVVI